MGICVSCRRRERKAPEKRSAPGTGGPVKGTAAAELLPRRSDRLPTMANSMSNIKMTNPLKGMVSKRRRRYQEDGFNLDLAYITDRLIAMGIPAEKLEGVYRNHIDEVFRFLEQRHKDRYQIYNLCSERSYDESKFHKRVVGKYAFDDHTPPKIENIQPFCEDVHRWLSSDPNNVAAVHCKAGKGRTGTMVCCYLLYSGQKATADEALKFYGKKRTLDEKGVTIPSQRRYVEYFGWLLRSGLQYTPTRVYIKELVMSPPPIINGGQFSPEITITQAKNCNFNSMPFKKPPSTVVERAPDKLRAVLTDCTVLRGDVRVDVYNKRMKMRKEKLFHFWFNTFFVTAQMAAVRVSPLSDSSEPETYKLTLNKWQLDDAHKDKQHKHYPEDFKVEVIVERVPESSKFTTTGRAPPSPSPRSTSPSSSEPDTEPDAHWDSGELPYLPLQRRVCAPLSHSPTPSPSPSPSHSPHAETFIDDKPKFADECSFDDKDALVADRYSVSHRMRDDAYVHRHLAGDDRNFTDERHFVDRKPERSFEDRDPFLPKYYSAGSTPDNTAYSLAADARRDYFDLPSVLGSDECESFRDATFYKTDSGYFQGAANDFYKDKSECRNSAGSADCFETRSDCCKDSVRSSGYRTDSAETHSSEDKNSSESTKNSVDTDSSSERRSKETKPSNDHKNRETHKVTQTDNHKSNGKKSEGRTRLSLGDVRASWRGLSGKFNADSRKKKDES